MEEVLVIGGVGLVAVAILTPIVGLVNPELSKAISDSAYNLAKDSLKLALDTCDKVQTSFAEAGESWEDLVAEAKTELETSRNSNQPPRQIEIIQD